MQVFDLKTCLPAEPYDLSGRKLLTRNTTRQAWQATFELMKDGARRVAMLGTPGIGKSRSLLGVWHLVSGHRPDWIKEPKAIVFKVWEGLKVFTFSKNKDGRWKGHSLPIGKWDASDCEHLQNSDNWYVVDGYLRQGDHGEAAGQGLQPRQRALHRFCEERWGLCVRRSMEEG